jgi:hypothetical protein
MQEIFCQPAEVRVQKMFAHKPKRLVQASEAREFAD